MSKILRRKAQHEDLRKRRESRQWSDNPAKRMNQRSVIRKKSITSNAHTSGSATLMVHNPAAPQRQHIQRLCHYESRTPTNMVPRQVLQKGPDMKDTSKLIIEHRTRFGVIKTELMFQTARIILYNVRLERRLL